MVDRLNTTINTTKLLLVIARGKLVLVIACKVQSTLKWLSQKGKQASRNERENNDIGL